MRSRRFENHASVPSGASAATDRIDGRSYAAGYSGTVSASFSLLPAAAVTSSPASPAAAITSHRGCEIAPPNVQLRLATRISWAAANAIARTPSETKPLPSLSSTRSGTIRAPYATPATPTPLSPTAAIVPATWVPWPFSSSGVASSATKSQPCTSST